MLVNVLLEIRGKLILTGGLPLISKSMLISIVNFQLNFIYP
jgi:hypothetical protein